MVLVPENDLIRSGFDKESQRIYVQLVHVGDKDGRAFIILANKSKSGRWQQHAYRWSELLSHLRKINDSYRLNRYASVQGFSGINRCPGGLFRLNAISYDIDYHESCVSEETVLGDLSRLSEAVFEKDILPYPSIMVFTGRGLQLLYLLEHLPKQGLPLWVMVGEAMAERLEDGISALGLEGQLDKNYSDVSRVMRIPGTYNTEAGRFARLLTPASEEDAVYYRLDSLRDQFLSELIPDKDRKTKPPPSKKAKRILRIFNAYSLHCARLEDIEKLRELRKEQELPEDYRRRMVFLFRYWSCFYYGKENALEAALEFNRGFKNPLPEGIVKQDTLSAEEAYERWKVDHKKGYNYRSDTLIKMLNITLEEQQQLSSIISKEEKMRRLKDKNWGNSKREEERRSKKRKEEAGVLELLKSGCTRKVIREKTGKSFDFINRVAKENKNVSEE